jgi:ABC-type taurine transport system substrate-binding protein
VLEHTNPNADEAYVWYPDVEWMLLSGEIVMDMVQ